MCGKQFNRTPDADALKYPAGKVDEEYEGLFEQLNWVANRMNLGYYGWTERGTTVVEFGDRSHAYLAAGLNPGTAGVQYWLALESDWATWHADAEPAGSGPAVMPPGIGRQAARGESEADAEPAELRTPSPQNRGQ